MLSIDLTAGSTTSANERVEADGRRRRPQLIVKALGAPRALRTETTLEGSRRETIERGTTYMEAVMGVRGATLLHRLVLGWLTLTFVLAWLPLVRCVMDGTSYEWGTRYFGLSFSGAGLTGDLWLLLVQTTLGLWLLYRGWRDPSPPFPAVLLAWLGLVAADALYNIFTGAAVQFEGATLGVNVSLATVAPVLHLGFFCAALAWALWSRSRIQLEPRPSWTGTNKALLAGVVLLFPVQFLLLRYAQGQEIKDVVGVLLTIAQWFLISAALYPWKHDPSMVGSVRELIQRLPPRSRSGRLIRAMPLRRPWR